MEILDTKIKLISFNGTLEAPKDCDPKENYWSLIGEIGIIKTLKNDRNRFLVQKDLC